MSLSQAIDEYVRISPNQFHQMFWIFSLIDYSYLYLEYVQKNNRSEWNTRIKDGMVKDFSWDSECAEVHISAYQVVKKL